MKVSFTLYTQYYSLTLYRQVLVWQGWNYIVETKKVKRIWADKLWICESIKIVSIKVKGPNGPVKKKKVLQAIQVDIPGNIL